MRKKIFVIFGTRPEAIKMAPVIHELKNYRDLLETVVCITAQHREMLDQILNAFGIVPDIDFDIMQEDQTLPEVTSRAMEKLTLVYSKYRPDLILIQGDTTTAMVAALAGFYERIPIGHIEAGLRTYNRYYPFPEEINRRLITVLATYHFAPTRLAKKALISEKVPENLIFVTGNTVIDALKHVIGEDVQSKKALPENLPCQDNLPSFHRRIILVTAHRRENFGTPMLNICEAILAIANRNEDIQILFPVHMNPKVRDTVYRILGNHQRIFLVDPLDYRNFVKWMNRAYLILTDSGGIQEEAAALGKPILVLRNQTERTEGIAKGIARITGTDTSNIIQYTEEILNDRKTYSMMARRSRIYGDGMASKRIVQAIIKILMEDQ